jgi:hypothetical protein
MRGVATRPIENSLQALLAARFRAQAQMVAALTDHPVLVGTGRESAVGALLQELLPRRFEVLTGVVAQLDENGAPRRTTAQADLMVVDTLDFPVLLRAGNTAIVVPDSVRALVEVKSALARPPGGASGDEASEAAEGASGASETFLDALVQIGKLRLAVPDGGRSVHTVLLSYGAPVFPRRLREWLEMCVAARGRMDPSSVEASALMAFALPDMIVSVAGAMAFKNFTRTAYEFFRCPADGSKDASAVVEAVGKLLLAVAPTIPADRVRVDRAFSFVQSYLATAKAPADGCPSLPI